MSVLLDDHWADHPVWAPLVASPAMHARAYLLHSAAVQWLSYWRAERIPKTKLRTLVGWSRAAELALVETVGLLEADGDSYRVTHDGRPGVDVTPLPSSPTPGGAPTSGRPVSRSRSEVNADNARKRWAAKRANGDATDANRMMQTDAIRTVSHDANGCDSHPPLSPTPPIPDSKTDSIADSDAREGTHESAPAGEDGATPAAGCESHDGSHATSHRGEMRIPKGKRKNFARDAWVARFKVAFPSLLVPLKARGFDAHHPVWEQLVDETADDAELERLLDAAFKDPWCVDRGCTPEVILGARVRLLVPRVPKKAAAAPAPEKLETSDGAAAFTKGVSADELKRDRARREGADG